MPVRVSRLWRHSGPVEVWGGKSPKGDGEFFQDFFVLLRGV